VYAVTGSKRDILAELLRQAQQAPAAEELRARLRTTEDTAARVRLAAAIARHVYEQMAGGLDLLRGAAFVAPELAAVAREIEDRRHDGVALLLEHLAHRGHLRAGLSPAAATDLAWALTGPDLYRKLVVDQGWTGEMYERVLGDALVEILLGSRGSS
jgi:hypothetical protein